METKSGKRQDRIILSIDLKSFYASVECILQGRDPFQTPLVVADESRGDGTIVLAASPFIKKKYGVKSRCRLYEVPKDIPGLIIACPSMAIYLKVSAEINGIYLDYVDKKDLYVYSIDESFLDVTHYLGRNKDTPRSYAEKIIQDIKDRTGLTVTAGIGKNLFMAKAAMDIEAKHRADCLAEWDYSSIEEHLWPVTPLSKMWGIGARLEKKLNDLGLYAVGDIAVSDPSFLKYHLGVIGEEIYNHAWGYDDALLSEPYTSKERSISVGQVLLRDYWYCEMPIVIADMAIEMSTRLYKEKCRAMSFALYIGYKDHTGFGHKFSFTLPTDEAEKIREKALEAFQECCKSKDKLFREVSLVAFEVTKKDAPYQGSLFEDTEKEEKEEKLRKLEETCLKIRKSFGNAKAMPASALTLSSTFFLRANEIGGHHR